MDQELNDLIISMKKQNANSVYELLKAQKKMEALESKIKSLETAIHILLEDKKEEIEEKNRLTIEKLNELKKFL